MMRIGSGAFLHPSLRHDLVSGPIALVEIEQREPREVPRAHAHGISGVYRGFTANIFAILEPVVLHADRLCDLLIECLEDAGARRLLVDRAERVEVPIVVVPEAAGRVAAARRPRLGHVGRLVKRGVVDAGTRLEKLAHGRALLDLAQGRRIIVDAEFAERAVEIDPTFRHRDADQRAEQALAHRGKFGRLRRVAPLGHHLAVMNDDDCARPDLVRESARLRQPAL